MSSDRHSRADPIELIADENEKAVREAENGVRQFQAAREIIRAALKNTDKKFLLKQSVILELNKEALDGIHPLAGTYRNS